MGVSQDGAVTMRSVSPIIRAAPVRLDAAGRVDADITGVRCGYNLRGLDPAGVCPECAAPVGPSLRSDLLRYADPH